MVCSVRVQTGRLVAAVSPLTVVMRSAVHMHPLWAVLVAMAAFAGCSPAAKRPLAATSGTVTYNGSPLANAEVFFIPVGGNGDALARGRTDANGAFVLSTFNPGDGAWPGDKRVRIVAQEELRVFEMGDNEPGSPGYVAPKDLIPKKYFSEATSGLKATVVAGKQNRFEFALTDEK